MAGIKHKILLVDDEEGILKALKRLLRETGAEILTATNGQDALGILIREKISLVVSDQRMPGMTGVELLQRSKEISSDTIRILLTGFADMEVTLTAVNSGAIRYYLTKPWEDESLLSRIVESLDLYETKVENARLQELTKQQNLKLTDFNQKLRSKVEEQTEEIRTQHQQLKVSFMDTIKAFSTIVGLRLKDVASHSQRVASLVKLVLKSMNLPEKEYQDVVVASYLHDIGKIGLPDSIAGKTSDQCSPHEKEVLFRHPVLGQSCVAGISGFEEIGRIIRHHHENFDGTGYPDCLIADKIPLGSRILRICDSFDHMAQEKDYPDLKTLQNATTQIQRFSGSKYDPNLVRMFGRLDIANKFYLDDSKGIIGLKPADLKEGMVVAMDIKTVSGVFLLPKGAKLSTGMISRINKMHTADPIIEAIRVYAHSLNPEESHVTS